MIDDFVDVTPDDAGQTREANNGLLTTQAIKDTAITARPRIATAFYDVRFRLWRIVYVPEGALGPEENGNTLTVRTGYLGYAFAFYGFPPGYRPPPLRRPEIIPFWQQVVSGQAGGSLVIIGGTFPTGEPGPRGPEPGDTYTPVLKELSSQVTDLSARLRAVENRLKEKLGG
jgi:hypothetical protein